LIVWDGVDHWCDGICTQAARAFTEDEVMLALELTGLGAFRDAVAAKLFEFDEITLAKVASIVAAVSMPAADVLRFKKTVDRPSDTGSCSEGT
jgi:hypothetical protein